MARLVATAALILVAVICAVHIFGTVGKASATNRSEVNSIINQIQ